jgi:hypothetical protein
VLGIGPGDPVAFAADSPVFRAVGKYRATAALR